MCRLGQQGMIYIIEQNIQKQQKTIFSKKANCKRREKHSIKPLFVLRTILERLHTRINWIPVNAGHRIQNGGHQ